MLRIIIGVLVSLNFMPTIYADDTTPHLYVIGDSTAASYEKQRHPLTGWAQVLQEYLDESKIVVINKAISGRSSKSYRDEGHWAPIQDRLKEGDYVFIQFGHNDQKKNDPKRYSDAFGTYTDNLRQYIKDTRATGALPVLLTSINRNSWVSDTELGHSLENYPEAVRALAEKENIPLLDLEKITRTIYEDFGPTDVRKLFLYFDAGEQPNYPEDKNDGTHLSDFGAHIIAEAAATNLQTLIKPFDNYVDLPKALFYQGMNNVPVYRIPALIVTPNDVVIAICDARAGNGQDLPNDIDIVMRRSTDSGETWSKPTVIADFGKQGVGDPSLLVDQSNGRLWCFFTYAPDGVGVKTSKPGILEGTFQLHMMYSDDDGDTWSTPRNLNKAVKNPTWDAVWSSPGLGYQDSSGRLYFPLSRKSDDTFYSHFIYSDDHGESWSMSNAVHEKCEEWMLVQRSNGDLVANMRNHLEQNRRAISISSDQGSTWKEFKLDDELLSPVCQACLTWYDYKDERYLLFSNPTSTQRERLSLKLSKDEGETWPYEKVIHPGPAAYSCMAVLPDGSIGILFEGGDKTPYQKIIFRKFTLKELMN